MFRLVSFKCFSLFSHILFFFFFWDTVKEQKGLRVKERKEEGGKEGRKERGKRKEKSVAALKSDICSSSETRTRVQVAKKRGDVKSVFFFFFFFFNSSSQI